MKTLNESVNLGEWCPTHCDDLRFCLSCFCGFAAVGGLGNLAEVKVFDDFFLNGKPTRPNHKNQRCSENTFANFHVGSLFTSLGFIF